LVPGVPLAAWSGPDGSSLVVYRALAIPGGSGASIVEALANRLDHLPGLEIRERRVDQVAGTTAGRVEVTAPGIGVALAPSGAGTPVAPEGQSLVPTRQVTVALVRPDGTLYLTWHMPESAYARVAPDIQATLDTIRFTSSSGPASYSYSD
jgi:hypothetical protein